MYYLKNLLLFDIPSLYYYTKLNSSMICCLFSRDIYLSFGISPSFLSVFECHSFEHSSTECNSFKDFEIVAILSAILLQVKSPVASAV